jgi:hypothetical protein
MADQIIVLRPKKWVKISYYITAATFIPLTLFLLYSYLFNGNGDGLPFLFNLSMIISAIILFFVLSLSLPFFHHFRITFTEEGIEQHGFFKKSIPYEEIDTISVDKGMIAVRTGSFFQKLSIGNLYTNFEEAAKFLSQQIAAKDRISFKGNEKHIERFFNSE